MLNWFHNLGRWAKVATMVSAFTGAIIGTAAAWPIIEWMVPVHRGLLYHEISDVKVPINELLIWKFEDAKKKAEGEASDWTIKLQKEDDPDTRRMIQKRINELKKDQDVSDERIKKLSR